MTKAEGPLRAEQVLLRVFAPLAPSLGPASSVRSFAPYPSGSNARWCELGGCAAEEVEFRAEGSEEGGKSPNMNQ
jgi:hypothetical protein